MRRAGRRARRRSRLLDCRAVVGGTTRERSRSGRRTGRVRLRALPAVLVGAVLVAPVPGAAEQPVPELGEARAASALDLPQPGAGSWRLFTFPRIERHTRYRVVHPPELAGRGAFHSEAECSASAMILNLDEVSLSRTPYLAWRWRVLAWPGVGDETSRGGDDFAARVYVMFRFDAEHANLWRRARQRLTETLDAGPAPGVALTFVWARRVAAGRRWLNPYSEEAAMIALRTGHVAEPGWRREEVDLVAEYQRAFGRPPTEPLALAVMTDADGTCTGASAEFADFQLLPPPPQSGPR